MACPKDLDSAIKLGIDDKHQFQQWARGQVGGYPREKKGGDKGVDGWFNYLAEGGKIESGVISVKGGKNFNPGMVRDLGRVMERDKHRFGLFITAAMPTKGVRDEIADSHPLIETEFGRFPAMQVVTIAELIDGPKPKLPPLISPVRRRRVLKRARATRRARRERCCECEKQLWIRPTTAHAAPPPHHLLSLFGITTRLTAGRHAAGSGDGLRQTIKIFRFEFCFHAGDRLVEGPALRCPDALGAEMNCCLPLGAVEGVFVEGE